jgi:basic membrane protein A
MLHPGRPLLLLATAALVFGACATTGSPSPTASPSPSAGSSQAAMSSPSPSPSPDPVTCDALLRVGLVTDGRVDSPGYNASARAGMVAAANDAPTCFELSYAEATDPSEFASKIAGLVDGGSDLVIGVGYRLADALGDAAKANPDTDFLAVDGIPGAGHDETWQSNGASLFYSEDQAGYLAGVLAASLSKARVVGAVGGLLAVPFVERYLEGFLHGAKATDPTIDVRTASTDTFFDAAEGKTAAKELTDAGADVILAVRGESGDGALVAACDAGIMAIGTDTDRAASVPEAQRCLVSSATWKLDESVRQALLRYAGSGFEPGVHTDGTATKSIALTPFREGEERVTPDVVRLLDRTLDGLADGSITTDVVVDGAIR